MNHLGDYNSGEQKCHIFSCNYCDYNTSDKWKYKRHCLTKTHLSNFNDYKMVTIPKCQGKSINDKNYKCLCGKLYNHRQNLYRHKKVCEYKEEQQQNSLVISQPIGINEPMIIEIMKQNYELNKQNYELNKQNHEFQKIIAGEIKDIKCSINNSNNINNNMINNSFNKTNNHFNLNFFLNETCKNALNLSDFIESIQVQLQDLENVEKVGYAEGISQIIINKLNELNVTDRPIHCTDARRDSLYIREGNVWTKEDGTNENLRNAIKIIGKKNMEKISEWKNKYPGCSSSDSRYNDKYLRMISNAMSGSTKEEQQKNMNKIVKNIIKSVVVDKEQAK